MKKIIEKAMLLACILIGTASTAQTASQDSTITYLDRLKSPVVDVNLLLRSSFEAAINSSNKNAFRLNEARLEVRGALRPQLEYRVRYRLVGSTEPNNLDGSPNSLDLAYVNYKFGKNQKWNFLFGKQANNMGSWEFENNPTFEYRYSNFVNVQSNLFLMAGLVGYQYAPNQGIQLQVYNTQNSRLNTYVPFPKEEAKTPLGVNLTWRASFFDGGWQPYYSVGTAKVVQGEQDFQVVIGNRFKAGKLSGYLDLHSTHMPYDYVQLATAWYRGYNPQLSEVLTDVRYQSGVLRLDYNFSPRFTLTAKEVIESANRNSSNVYEMYLNHLITLVGLEYKPLPSQDMKLFGYYSRTTNRFQSGSNQPNRFSEDIASAGILYFINAF